MEAGLVLLTELGCLACHEDSGIAPDWLVPKQAPDLSEAGRRIRPQYLHDWVAVPHSLKPGSTMPDMLAGLSDNDREKYATALTHFLISRGGPLPPAEIGLEEDGLEDGEALFHTVGCVACHDPRREKSAALEEDDFWDEAEAIEAPPIVQPSVPLPDLARKTSAAALAGFLEHPLAIRPSGRMPDMKLTSDEASALATYLTHPDGEASVPPVFVVDPNLAREGERLFASLGCAACHEKPLADAYLDAAPPLSNVIEAERGAGCLTETPALGRPFYSLSLDQRDAVATALAALNSGLSGDNALAVDHRLAALNCYACHPRGGLDGPEPGRMPIFEAAVDADLGEEGRLPPDLSGVGAKLTPTWLEAILRGEEDVRPYMKTRMPRFGWEQVALLASRLPVIDQDPHAPEVNVTGLEHHHRNLYGRQLAGVNGLGCVNCHGLNGHPSLGVPAVDLAHAPDRLQPTWFMKYLLDPASLRPGTRMPAFFAEGKSTFPALFEGDARKQIEALWIYLKEVDQTRLPEGMEGTDNFELVPEDAPIVLRTFMKDVGMRAIAVGFPEGVHAAFDAGLARFLMSWKGRFLDAGSTWSDRFSPLAEPLGQAIWRFPEGPALVCLESRDTPWPRDATETIPRFLGYRLDSGRVPVFRYTCLGMVIEDRVQPLEGSGWSREISFGGTPESLYFLAARSSLITQDAEDAFTLADGSVLRVQSNGGEATIMRKSSDIFEVLLPIPVSTDRIEITQQVRW